MSVVTDWCQPQTVMKLDVACALLTTPRPTCRVAGLSVSGRSAGDHE